MSDAGHRAVSPPSLAFLAAWRLVVGNEGAYSDNSDDPGGATMWGITEQVARKYGYTGLMQELPQTLAEQIGYSEYWLALHLDELDPKVAENVFDGNYNSGEAHAVKWLQESCGAGVDGKLGSATITAANAMPPGRLIARFNARRLLYLANLDKWSKFGRGWVRRIANNLLSTEN